MNTDLVAPEHLSLSGINVLWGKWSRIDLNNIHGSTILGRFLHSCIHLEYGDLCAAIILFKKRNSRTRNLFSGR